MRGIIFTELLEMVEQAHGYELVDKVISKAKLESGGIFTSVGFYPYSDMVQILIQLSEETGSSIGDLQQVFGKHLFGRFSVKYPHFFEGETSAFNFLSRIESKIHPQVLKLYPDAELPTFEIVNFSEHNLEMIYKSERAMARLAEGLIEGCLEHFGEKATIRVEQLDENGKAVRFCVDKSPE